SLKDPHEVNRELRRHAHCDRCGRRDTRPLVPMLSSELRRPMVSAARLTRAWLPTPLTFFGPSPPFGGLAARVREWAQSSGVRHAGRTVPRPFRGSRDRWYTPVETSRTARLIGCCLRPSSNPPGRLHGVLT